MPISVVVPTRGRAEALARCVAALEAQTVAVEVVVVEDAEGRGPAWARNEGVRRARGEVVCFTDDDCEPVAGWVEALTGPIVAGEAEASTGPVTVGEGATAADRAWEVIVNYLQVRAVAPGTASPGFAVTANLAAKYSLLEWIPFDESFPAAAGEDRDWGERAARAGAAPLATAPPPPTAAQARLRSTRASWGRGSALADVRASSSPPARPPPRRGSSSRPQAGSINGFVCGLGVRAQGGARR